MQTKQNRMYSEFADLWTLISSPADYAVEAGYWRDALKSKLGPGRHSIFEMGVGGGNNLSHLAEEFDVTASDISKEMLEQCRKLLPGIPLHVGDMRTLRIQQQFDAVLIHDAIDYLTTEQDIAQTLATAAAHLRTGGVLIVAPDHYSETFHSPQVRHSTCSNATTELTLVEYQCDPDPADTIMESHFVYFIRTDGTLRVEHDRHVFGLFPLQTWLDLFEKMGFSVEKMPYPVHDDGHEAYLLVGEWKGSRSP